MTWRAIARVGCLPDFGELGFFRLLQFSTMATKVPCYNCGDPDKGPVCKGTRGWCWRDVVLDVRSDETDKFFCLRVNEIHIACHVHSVVGDCFMVIFSLC